MKAFHFLSLASTLNLFFLSTSIHLNAYIKLNYPFLNLIILKLFSYFFYNHCLSFFMNLSFLLFYSTPYYFLLFSPALSPNLIYFSLFIRDQQSLKKNFFFFYKSSSHIFFSLLIFKYIKIYHNFILCFSKSFIIIILFICYLFENCFLLIKIIFYYELLLYLYYSQGVHDSNHR